MEILWKGTVYGNLPETLRKLCLISKFPHQEIRWSFTCKHTELMPCKQMRMFFPFIHTLVCTVKVLLDFFYLWSFSGLNTFANLSVIIVTAVRFMPFIAALRQACNTKRDKRLRCSRCFSFQCTHDLSWTLYFDISWTFYFCSFSVACYWVS